MMGALPWEALTEQAQVTNWPARLALVALMLGLIALALWGMRRGWRGRQARQAGIPEPHPVVASEPHPPAVEGLYLGSATAGQWLDRIAVHGLGVRSRATIAWSSERIEIFRQGAPSFSIAGPDIISVRTDSGVASTVRSKDSVVVVTWRLGEFELDTGFRADDGAGHRTLLDGLMATFPSGARS